MISRARAARARAYRFIARTRTSVGTATGRSPQVLLDTASRDYHLEDEQPSYVLAIECRPVCGVCALPRWRG